MISPFAKNNEHFLRTGCRSFLCLYITGNLSLAVPFAAKVVILVTGDWGSQRGIAASPYRSLPPRGRGTASAVDRVLSYIACLRRSSPALFHTARTLSGSLRSPPSTRGEGFVSGKYCMHTLFACETAILSYRHLPKV